VGVSQAIQRTGPVFALLFGAWLTGQVGPNAVFLILAIPTALAIPIALALPAADVQSKKGRREKVSLARPKPIDVFFFCKVMA